MGLIDSKKLLAEAIARTKPKKASPVAQPPLEEASAPMYPEVSPEGPQQFPDTDPQAAIEQAASVGVQQALGGKDASAAQAVPPQPQDELQSLLAQVKDAQDRRDQLRSKHSELLGAYQIIGGRASSNLAPVKAGIYKDQEAAATGDIGEQQALVNQAKNQSLQQQKAESDLGLNKNLRDAQSPVSQGKLAFINDILKRSGYSELPPGVSAAEADSVIGALGIGSGIFKSEEAQKGVNDRFKESEDAKVKAAEAKAKAALELAKTKAGLRGTGVSSKQAEKDALTEIPGFKKVPGMAVKPEIAQKLRDASASVQSIGSSIDNIKALYKKHGNTINPADRAAVESAVIDLELMAKNKDLYDLGVLAGEDRKLLEAVIGNPTSVRGTIEDLMSGGKATMARIEAFRSNVNSRLGSRMKQSGYEAEAQPAKQSAPDMVMIRDTNSGEVTPMTALDAATVLKAGGYEVVNGG